MVCVCVCVCIGRCCTYVSYISLQVPCEWDTSVLYQLYMLHGT